MRKKIAPLACLVVLTLAPLAPRAALAQWPMDGAVMSNHGSVWDEPVQLFPDGAGGFLSGWRFHGGGDTQLFATRMTSVGTVADGWPANGLSFQSVFDGEVAPDGVGGLIVVASIRTNPSGDEIHAWHVLPTGVLDWNGPVANTTETERGSHVIGDGAGGCYVAWVRGIDRLYLQHLQSNGVRFPGWPAAGLLVSAGYFVFDRLTLAPDGSGGALVLWMSDYTRVQRVTASGALATDWYAGGIPLGVNAPDYEGIFRIIPAGPDLFMAVWQDHPSSGRRLLVQRVGLDGTVDGAYPNGLVATDGVGAALVADAASDGADGLLLGWTIGGANARGLRYFPDGALATGWPASGVLLRSGAIGGFAVTNAGGGGMVFASNAPNPAPGYVKWFLGDGTQDPSQPSGGQLVHPTNGAVNIRTLMPDGGGGVYVAWDKYNTSDIKMVLMLSRVTYPTPLAVGPRLGDGGSPDLRLIGPNPSRGDFAMSCTIAAGVPARLELLDLAGRRIRAVALDGAGTRTVRFDDVGSLRPGVYLVHLTQAARSRTARVAIVR